MLKMVFRYFPIEIDLEILGEKNIEHRRRESVEISFGFDATSISVVKVNPMTPSNPQRLSYHSIGR